MYFVLTDILYNLQRDLRNDHEERDVSKMRKRNNTARALGDVKKHEAPKHVFHAALEFTVWYESLDFK